MMTLPRTLLIFVLLTATLSCGGGGGGGSDSGSSAGTDPGSCSRLLETTPRGFSCLHCNQPEARAQVEELIAMQQRSCLKNLATMFLVDGTFSFDDAYMQDIIRRLTENGRSLSVIFYVANGASQRTYDRTPISSHGVQMSPESYREAIVNDESIRGEYSALIARLLPTLRYAQSRGATLYLTLVLEDNLTNYSFEAGVLALARAALPADIAIQLVRNACSDCYPGNQGGTPSGVLTEVHSDDPDEVPTNGIYSNDGVSFDVFNNPGLVQLEDLNDLLFASTERNTIFILWKHEYQGLGTPEVGSGSTVLAPSEREYRLPHPQEVSRIIEFLQQGAN